MKELRLVSSSRALLVITLFLFYEAATALDAKVLLLGQRDQSQPNSSTSYFVFNLQNMSVISSQNEALEFSVLTFMNEGRLDVDLIACSSLTVTWADSSCNLIPSQGYSFVPLSGSTNRIFQVEPKLIQAGYYYIRMISTSRFVYTTVQLANYSVDSIYEDQTMGHMNSFIPSNGSIIYSFNLTPSFDLLELNVSIANISVTFGEKITSSPDVIIPSHSTNMKCPSNNSCLVSMGPCDYKSVIMYLTIRNADNRAFNVSWNFKFSKIIPFDPHNEDDRSIILDPFTTQYILLSLADVPINSTNFLSGFFVDDVYGVADYRLMKTDGTCQNFPVDVQSGVDYYMSPCSGFQTLVIRMTSRDDQPFVFFAYDRSIPVAIAEFGPMLKLNRSSSSSNVVVRYHEIETNADALVLVHEWETSSSVSSSFHMNRKVISSLAPSDWRCDPYFTSSDNAAKSGQELNIFRLCDFKYPEGDFFLDASIPNGDHRISLNSLNYSYVPFNESFDLNGDSMSTVITGNVTYKFAKVQVPQATRKIIRIIADSSINFNISISKNCSMISSCSSSNQPCNISIIGDSLASSILFLDLHSSFSHGIPINVIFTLEGIPTLTTSLLSSSNPPFVTSARSDQLTSTAQITSGSIAPDQVVGATGGSFQTTASSNSNIGMYIGIGIGVPVVIIVLFVVIIVLRRSRKSSHQPGKSSLALVGYDSDHIEMHIAPISPKIPLLKNVQIKRELGSGNFGLVYLGEFNQTPVAIKKLKNHLEFEKFMKEAEMLIQIGTHPNIVQFLGLYVDDHGEQHIVLEFIQKGSLQQYLVDHSSELSFMDLMDMIMSSVRGMLFLSEEKNILHGDLAARNLLVYQLDGKYAAKISDFGMAKCVSEHYYKGSQDTPIPIRWVAPEGMKNKHFDSRSDVWAFGVVMWEILSYGKLPYSWLTNKQVSEAVPSGERLPQPSICPDDLWRIIQTCWIENPDGRPTFGGLATSLKKFYNTTFSIDDDDQQTVRDAVVFPQPVITGPNYMNQQDLHLSQYGN